MPDFAPPRAAVQAVLGVRRTLHRTADRLLPAEFAAFLLSVEFMYSRALGTFAELGIADELADGPKTAADIAERLDLDADALHRTLRLLALRGVLKLSSDGRFGLTRIGRMATSDHPRSVRSWLRYIMLDSTQLAYAGLTDTVRTGEPSFQAVHGKSVWQHFAETPEEEQLFASAMQRLTEFDLPSITGGYPWPDEGRVCDVAGGVGTMLAGILRAKPRLRGVLVDGAGVLAEADGYLRERGVRDRVELSEGDMFEQVAAEADVYTLKDVLHDWDDERCLKVLRTVRAAMPDGARVVLVENLQEPNTPHDSGSMVDFQMLTQCDGGRQRSVAELHALLRSAGLRPGEVHLTGGPALVEGVAAD